VYAARTPRPKAELLKWWNWVNAGSKAADLMSAGPRERRHTEVPAGPKAKQGRVAQSDERQGRKAAAGTRAEQESEAKRRRLRNRVLEKQ
jgi:hypothetical protein